MDDTSGVSAVSAMLIAQVERDLAALLADDEVADNAAARLSSPRQRTNSSSVIFTLRLGPNEVTALQRRAAARGLAPSVLARTLIRSGLQPAIGAERLLAAVDASESATAAVRAAMPTAAH